MIRVKVCCIGTVEEARTAIRLGASALGLVCGLNPDNVGEAIRAVRPFGVDLCSGVRTDGTLDERKLARFMAAVSAAVQ